MSKGQLVFGEMRPPAAMVRRNIKDAVFRSLFSRRSNIVRLYEEACPSEAPVAETDIKQVRLDPVLRKGVVNDLAFTAGKDVLCVVDAQSRDDPTIVFRCMQYLYKCLEGLVLSGRLSRRDLAHQRWRAYVVYPAVGRHAPDGEMLRLTRIPDDFADFTAFSRVDIPGDGLVTEYIRFCNIVNGKITKGRTDISVLREVFDECVSSGVLRDFLTEHRGEIMDLYYQMTNVEYNHQLDVEASMRKGERKGMRKGLREGRNQGDVDASRRIARALLERGDSVESVSEVTGLGADEVAVIRDGLAQGRFGPGR